MSRARADVPPFDHRSLADALPRVYWTDREIRPAPVPRARLVGEASADLVIIGGGFTGLWAALHAVEDNPGRSVVVLEGGELGWGASGRNGGFVAPSLTHGLAQGLALWPDEIDTLERLGRENFAGIEAAVERYDIDCDLHVPGEITFALTEHQIEAVREGFALHRDQGADVTLLDREQCRERVDSPRYLAGFVDHEVGLVDPARLVWGLAAAAESLGVRVHEHSSVRRIERDGAGVRVITDAGYVRAGGAIVGTGAYPGPLKRLRTWLMPVYDHVLMSEPLTAAQLASIGWEGREGLTDAGNQFHYYRRTLDDRILFGGYDANYHFGGRIDPALDQSPSHDLLARHFFEIFPQLEGLRFTHRWAGVIDTTSRFTPFFGTAYGGRVAYVAGYTGLGVASTRFGARVALDLLDGRDTEATRLTMVRRKPFPLPPEPLRYAAVQVTRSELAREDRTGKRSPLLAVMDRFGVGFDS